MDQVHTRAMKRRQYHSWKRKNAVQVLPRIVEPREVTHACDDAFNILQFQYTFHKEGYFTKNLPSHVIQPHEQEALNTLRTVRGFTFRDAT